MKIKIISIHDIGVNFGSTLQACALYDFIKNNGYEDTIVINYKPKYAYNRGKLGQFIKKIIFFKYVAVQSKRFRKYYKEHCKLTPLYAQNQLLHQEKEGDVFVVGSDQVWNEFYDAGRDMAYYLKFTDCKRKMSYSASLGQIHTEEALQRLKDNISQFRYIAVREKESVKQLHNSGVHQVVHVLDPVFLHDKTYYIDPKFKNIYGNYLLVYLVHSDPFMERMVIEIANRLNLKIVLVGGFIQKCKHDYYLRDIGPSEFVNLIYHASFVIANSFHATAFCILLNKQFALINPNVSPLRLSDILDTAEIKDRIIRKEEDVDQALKPIDYERVNPIIEEKKRYSREYLLKCLQTFEEEVNNEEKK